MQHCQQAMPRRGRTAPGPAIARGANFRRVIYYVYFVTPGIGAEAREAQSPTGYRGQPPPRRPPLGGGTRSSAAEGRAAVMSSHPLVRGLIDLLKIPRRHTPLMQVRRSRWHCRAGCSSVASCTSPLT